YYSPMVLTQTNHEGGTAPPDLSRAKFLLSYTGNYFVDNTGQVDPSNGIPNSAIVVLPINQTGTKDLADAHNTIFNHPNVGAFICRELIQRLVTDNPSPGYVYRVAQKFADNGQGVRGDLAAVVKAILTDYEARSTAVLGYQGYGHLKEPLLRVSNIVRAFHPFSSSGYFK